METHYRSRIGFKTSAQIAEEKEQEVIVDTEVKNIVVGEQENENQIPITPAHAEVIERIRMCEVVMMQKGFSRKTKKEKMEIIEELEHQKAVDTQLMMGYIK